MKYLLTTIAALMIALPAYGQARDPMGENAYYDLDKSRSHNMIRSGNFDARITSFNPDAEGGPAYVMTLKYKFVIQWIGTKEGEEILEIPAEYFTEEFLVDLRANGTYETDKFKVKHEGFGDTTTMNGNRYPNCDKILIYDVEQLSDVPDFALAMIGYDQMIAANEIENLKIRAHIYYGTPVLGAVKLDVEGDTQGMHVYAGADYSR